MDEIVIRQLNEITKWIQSVISSSTPIHQLKDIIDNNNDLYIAVSNGIDTGKIIFKPNEVTKEDFDNLRNMQLGSDAETNTIFIQDGEGNILTALNMELFTRNFITNSEMEQTFVPDWSTEIERNINF